MKFFTLSKSKPSIVFSLEGPDSFLHIKKINLKTNEELQDRLSNFISEMQLFYALEYNVYDDEKGRFVDTRNRISPINFDVDPNQVHPTFIIDENIQNEKFTIGLNPTAKWFTTLKLELKGSDAFNQEFELEFDVESFQVKI